MSMSDPLGDMLTRIRNAQRSRHSTCVAPASKLRANVLEAMKRFDGAQWVEPSRLGERWR